MGVDELPPSMLCALHDTRHSNPQHRTLCTTTGIPKDMLKDYPVLAAFCDRVASIDAIAKYLEKREEPIYAAFKVAA